MGNAGFVPSVAVDEHSELIARGSATPPSLCTTATLSEPSFTSWPETLDKVSQFLGGLDSEQ